MQPEAIWCPASTLSLIAKERSAVGHTSRAECVMPYGVPLWQELTGKGLLFVLPTSASNISSTRL